MMVLQRVSQQFDPVRQMLDRLPQRDRRALIALTLFLLLFLLGGGTWLAHHKDQQARQDAVEARELLLWMRGQAPYLQQGPASTQPLSTLVQDAAAAQGLVISQSGGDREVQVSLTQSQFAVIGSWLSRLAAQGVQVSQLDIKQQSDEQLQVQVSFTQP
jgi:general secretion pathway protein M